MTRFFLSARTLAVALVTVGVLGGAACSSDGSDDATNGDTTTTVSVSDTADSGSGSAPDKQDFVDAFVVGISQSGVVTPDQGQCIGKAWVDVIGVAALDEAGITPEQFGSVDRESYQKLELSETEAGALYDLLAPCGFDTVAGLRSPASGDVTPEQKACVEKAITEESVRKAFGAGLTEVDGQKKLDALRDEAGACVAN